MSSLSPSVPDLVYDQNVGERGVGDLFLPDRIMGAPVVLIHGGGWNAMRNREFQFTLPYFLAGGRPVFNINYRLLSMAPWPACGDDCLSAARFVLNGGLTAHGVGYHDKILLCGGSAGGHLAMMTGLRLGSGFVEALLSLAGPGRLDWIAENRDPAGLHQDFLNRFFGATPTKEAIADASPALRRDTDRPPLFCLHSSNDCLVEPRHSEELVRIWTESGVHAEITTFPGDGDLHGFWYDSIRDDEHLRPEIGQFIERTLRTLTVTTS